jgi:hypothetical protein
VDHIKYWAFAISCSVACSRLMWEISRNHSSVHLPVRVLVVEVLETRAVAQVQEPKGRAVDVAMQQQLLGN